MLKASLREKEKVRRARKEWLWNEERCDVWGEIKERKDIHDDDRGRRWRRIRHGRRQRLNWDGSKQRSTRETMARRAQEGQGEGWVGAERVMNPSAELRCLGDTAKSLKQHAVGFVNSLETPMWVRESGGWPWFFSPRLVVTEGRGSDMRLLWHWGHAVGGLVLLKLGNFLRVSHHDKWAA